MTTLQHLKRSTNPDEVLAGLKEDKLDHRTTVFVFPSHAQASFKKTLYGRYSDKKNKSKGIDRTANLLSDIGMPTLGLPVEAMKTPAKPPKETTKLAKDALANLWRAAGAGFNIALVERPTDVQQENPWEPKGHEFPGLSAFYVQELGALEKFLAEAKPDIDTFEYEAEVTDDKTKLRVKQMIPLSPVYVTHYKEGLAAKAAPEAYPWFQPTPAKTIVNGVYADLFKQQEKDRGWKTALAWVVSIFTVGLLAYPMYRWWKNEKDNEVIQAIDMKPTQLAALSQFRKDLLAISTATKPVEVIADRDKRPQKAYATPDDAKRATANPDAMVTFLADKSEAQRVNFFNEAMQQNRQTALTVNEYKQLHEWTKESVAAASSPPLKPGN